MFFFWCSDRPCIHLCAGHVLNLADIVGVSVIWNVLKCVYLCNPVVPSFTKSARKSCCWFQERHVRDFWKWTLAFWKTYFFYCFRSIRFQSFGLNRKVRAFQNFHLFDYVYNSNRKSHCCLRHHSSWSAVSGAMSNKFFWNRECYNSPLFRFYLLYSVLREKIISANVICKLHSKEQHNLNYLWAVFISSLFTIF